MILATKTTTNHLAFLCYGFILTLSFLALRAGCLGAQTLLQPGDLAVLGVNANLSTCGEDPDDLISFVCFKDIEPNTVIQITDNGWERTEPGLWGNSEGFIEATRTGPTIPAGTAITFRLPAFGSDYQASTPDADWTFEQLSVNSLNFNSGGDQIHFLQGGNWEDPGTPGNFDHDANYTGGRFLFAFNTKTEWRSLQDSPQESGLHPALSACFSMAPTGGTTDFISYTGPEAEAPQLEWITRISNPANWTRYNSCPEYENPPATINLAPSGIRIDCSVCSGCDTLQETLTFRLPATGGPFTLEYTDGADTLSRSGLEDGAAEEVIVTDSTTFTPVSVTDAAGCPVFSNFEGGATVTVSGAPAANSAGPLQACGNDIGEAAFDLSGLDNAIRGGTNNKVSWFRNLILTEPITNPDNFITASTTVYAIVEAGNCQSEPVPVGLFAQTPPAADLSVEREISCSGATDGQINLTITEGVPPYDIDWDDNFFDDIEDPDNLGPGTYTVTVIDANSCSSSASITLDEPSQLLLNCGQEQPVSTVGGDDGTGTVDISGGSPPYAIEVNGPTSSSDSQAIAGVTTLTNLTAGNYTVTVTDDNGCQTNCNFTISDPDCSLALTVDGQPESCPGEDDGAIDLTLNGGTPGFTIDWSDDLLDGTEDPAGLAPGNYTLTVTDAAGCEATASYILTTANEAPSVSIILEESVCAEDCFGYDLSFAGEPPFQLFYEIDDGSGPQAFDQTFSDSNAVLELCPANFGISQGALEVNFLELQDANCASSLSRRTTIVVNPPITNDVQQTLCNNDSLVLNGVVYNSANPSGQEIIPGGSVSGCDSIINIDLTFLPVPEFQLDSTLCFTQSVTVNGRQYTEENPTGVEILEGQAANGCDSIVRVDLTFLEDTTVTLAPLLCPGDELTVNGAVYDENNPDGLEVLTGANGCDSTVIIDLQFASTEETLNQTLCAGSSITVNGTVYDENNPSGAEVLTSSLGCDSTVIIDLTFRESPTNFIDSTLCAGDSLLINGTTYNEANPTGTEILPGGSAFGCDSTIEVSLTFRPRLSATLEGGGRICPGDSIPLTFRLEGASTFDLVYRIEGGPLRSLDGISDGHAELVAPAETATYLIESISAENGADCPTSIQGAATVEVSDLRLSINQLNDFGGFGVSCHEAKDGAIEAVFEGGRTPVEFSWSDGRTEAFRDSLSAGTYRARVRDAEGCEITDSIELRAPAPLSVNMRGVPPSCADTNDGAIVLESVTGGASPFILRLDGSAAQPFAQAPLILNELSAGAYDLSLSDNNGCRQDTSIELGAPEPLVLDLGPDTTIKRGAAVDLRPRLNFQPENFNWSPTAGLSAPDSLFTRIAPVISTTLTLTANDSSGCTVSDRLSISVDAANNIFFPTAFSPNNDGNNDVFTFYSNTSIIESAELRVFDRWGNLVFQADNVPPSSEMNGWDGTFRGQDLRQGVYVWFARVFYASGLEEVLQGHVNLVR